MTIQREAVAMRASGMRKSMMCVGALLAGLVLPTVAAEAANVSRNVGVTLKAANLESYDLDIDLNGTIDFSFDAAYVPDDFLTVGFDQIKAPFASSNAIRVDMTTGDGFPTASLLGNGAVVTAANPFSGPNDNANLYYYITIEPASGNFGGKSGFVGFRFNQPDGLHYGYLQLSAKALDDATGPFDLTLGTVVYNDVAGAAIAVPEPLSLTMFAGLALVGFGGRRRR